MCLQKLQWMALFHLRVPHTQQRISPNLHYKCPKARCHQVRLLSTKDGLAMHMAVLALRECMRLPKATDRETTRYWLFAGQHRGKTALGNTCVLMLCPELHERQPVAGLTTWPLAEFTRTMLEGSPTQSTWPLAEHTRTMLIGSPAHTAHGHLLNSQGPCMLEGSPAHTADGHLLSIQGPCLRVALLKAHGHISLMLACPERPLYIPYPDAGSY